MTTKYRILKHANGAVSFNHPNYFKSIFSVSSGISRGLDKSSYLLSIASLRIIGNSWFPISNIRVICQDALEITKDD